MKSGLSLFIIAICMLTVCSNSIEKNLKRKCQKLSTPKAVDLKNHYGANSFNSQYGPQTDGIAQYVEANPDTFMPFKTDGRKHIEKQFEFKPYSGYEKKLNPDFIKSGDMTNIAPSASKIITPAITGPKLKMKTEITYPAVVKLPTFKGMKKEFHNVTAYDKEEGKIVHDKVLINHPNMVYETKVYNLD